MTTPKPVHFRVHKHGLMKGEVFAIMLTGPLTYGGDGAPILPTFSRITGAGSTPLTVIRHHSRTARPDEYGDLAALMKKHVGTVAPYPKLTEQFRRAERRAK